MPAPGFEWRGYTVTNIRAYAPLGAGGWAGDLVDWKWSAPPPRTGGY